MLPATVSVAAADTTRFFAYGRTTAGDSVPVQVAYTSTGGVIAGSGLYTAGGSAGTFRVIATSAAGLADTSEVIVSTAAVAAVTLLPDLAASRPGQVTRFVASVSNTLGAVVPEPVTYDATCGTVTSAGVFTAPLSASDPCLVTASAGEKADTTEVVLLINSSNLGVPFGIYDLWASNTTTQTSGVAAYTSGHD